MSVAATGAIDVHTHIFASGWDDFAARYGGDRWPRLVGDPSGPCKLYLGQAFNRALTPHAFDPARRIEDMDRTGIALQLLSPAPPTFCYWADGVAAAEWCRMQNDAIAAIVARHPDRFLGAGGLPLQAPDLAVKELERCAATLRFPVVEVGGNVEGRDLDDPALAPVAHGGGAFAYILPRLDHGWRMMDEARAAIPKPPSDYARRVWVDSLTLSPRVLTFALETFGAERVVVGSDYPFRLGSDDPVGALAPLGLDAGTRARLTRDNAREYLGLG